MNSNIEIAEKNLKKITELLSSILSTENALYIKTRQFHWNVIGTSVKEFHNLFQEHYEKLNAAMIEISEHIIKLRGPAIGTLEEFRHSVKSGSFPTSEEMVKELIRDHERFIIELRENIKDCHETYKDTGTAAFLTGLMKEHEILSWQLQRYLPMPY